MEDPAIVILLRRGDKEALALIAARYRARLVDAARVIVRDPAEAEDVAQDVLMRIGEARSLESAEALCGYLVSTARRLAIDRLRKRVLAARASRGAARDERVEGGAESATRADEAALAVRELNTLGEPYRSAVTMRYLRGLDFPQVAAELGTNERTARTWVGRGLAQLRRRAGGWK